MRNMNIREFLKNFDEGKYLSNDTDTQIEAGWFDWFCSNKALANKTIKLTGLLRQIVLSPKINQETMYVFFKNNCPLFGTLYDDFRICDMKTGDVIFTITPSSGHEGCKGEASVWGRENDFKEALALGTWNNVVKFFNQ